MSDEDRRKWDQRYADGTYRKGNPVTLLQDWLPKLTPGKALDVACGAGRNSILLAQTGHRVDAIDISAEGLKLARQQAEAAGLRINWIDHDLEQPFDFDADYDLIVVLWFVDLDLINRLCGFLLPGGHLICEVHLMTDEAVAGPQNPGFRVAPGALRDAVTGVDILLDEESVYLDDIGERIASARLVAKKP